MRGLLNVVSRYLIPWLIAAGKGPVIIYVEGVGVREKYVGKIKIFRLSEFTLAGPLMNISRLPGHSINPAYFAFFANFSHLFSDSTQTSFSGISESLLHFSSLLFTISRQKYVFVGKKNTFFTLFWLSTRQTRIQSLLRLSKSWGGGGGGEVSSDVNYF